MTFLGKLLVLFNLVFALTMATLLGVLAHLDWPSGIPDELKAGIEKTQEARKTVPPAGAGWLSQRRQLADAETRLAADRAWYDAEMRHVLHGPTVAANPPSPVGSISVAAKDDDKTGARRGQIQLDDNGFPLLVPLKDRNGEPLQSLDEYTKKDEDVLQALQDVIKKHEDQIAEAKRLTDLIIGDRAKGVRGFHDRIADEKAKDAAVLAEQKFIEPLLINTVVEAQLINKRHKQLVERVKELEKLKVAEK